MTSCLNCGIENPPSKSNKPRKYCSKKCANTYLHAVEAGRNPNSKNLNWKRKTIIEKLERAKKLTQQAYDVANEKGYKDIGSTKLDITKPQKQQ